MTFAPRFCFDLVKSILLNPIDLCKSLEMKILSLCFCNDYFPEHENLMIDVKFGCNVLDYHNDIGKEFDLILAAPPCDQFTKANSGHWLQFPQNYIDIAQKCFSICVQSGKPFVLENPPGRIGKFIVEIEKYRVVTFQDYYTNKEYVLYSNLLIMPLMQRRYGKVKIHAWNKQIREMWTVGLVEYIKKNIVC